MSRLARHLVTAERQKKQVEAYELSLQGLSFRTIGERLGVSHTTISALVRDEAEIRHKQAGNKLQRVVDMQIKLLTGSGKNSIKRLHLIVLQI